jgi:dihydropteroate synthase
MIWRCRHRILDLDAHPVVMGVLNVTPDSFSDGGRYANFGAALDQLDRAHGRGGRGIIDVGGESTRPGAAVVDESIETRARRAAHRGIAALSTLRSPSIPASLASWLRRWRRRLDRQRHLCAARAGAREWAATAGVGVCLMHMQGEPRTMQLHPHYDDVVAEVADFLVRRREACIAAGIGSEAIVLDPGIGFGKSAAHNSLLRGLSTLVAWVRRCSSASRARA